MLSAHKKYIDDNKYEKWDKWLEVDRVFPRQGKQGIVGVLKSKLDPDMKFVFKLSQTVNFLGQHEMAIMEGLSDIGEYCPHFCRLLGGIICEVNPSTSTKKNPFEITSKYPIEKEVILCELLKNNVKLYNYIKSDRCENRKILSIIKQTLCAISVSQKKKKFTHYDLHSNNVLLQKCDMDSVNLYILADKTYFAIPTHGNKPTIIDYGFSYSVDLDDKPLWPSLGHTEVGFTSYRFDPISDPKLFLVTLSDELCDINPDKQTLKLRRVVRNLFSGLDIDWRSGWDKNGSSISDLIYKSISINIDDSKVFTKYGSHCFDLLQTLVILPIQSQPETSYVDEFDEFLEEFVKIETAINLSFYSIYILKTLVSSARSVRYDWLNGRKDEAVDMFRSEIMSKIATITKFCRPKGVRWDKMLRSLFSFSRSMEGMMFRYATKLDKKYASDLQKLQIKSVDEMLKCLDINFPSEYIYTRDTTINVFDSVSESRFSFKLTRSDAKYINKWRSSSHSDVLKDMYEKKREFSHDRYE